MDLYAGIAMDVKNNYLWDPYVGIVYTWNGLMEIIIERM
jgi:hypothetical protein